MIRTIAACAALLAVVACSTADLTQARLAITIPDPMLYLVRDVGGRVQTVDDPLGQRRYDYGHYQETDSYALDATHAVTTWDYAPFGSRELPDDGGEQYV